MRQAYDYWQNQPGNNLERVGRGPTATPRGRVVHLMAMHRSTSQQLATRGADVPRRSLTTIQLPPLSSPQGGPRHQCSSAETPSHGATYTPQEEDTVRTSRQKRLHAWAYPRIALYKSSHRPFIYRIQQRPPDELTGLLALHPAWVSPPWAVFSVTPHQRLIHGSFSPVGLGHAVGGLRLRDRVT